MLPKSGPLTMVSAVSPRGKPWIESTTYSENLLFTPKIAPETARVLKESLPAGATDRRRRARRNSGRRRPRAEDGRREARRRDRDVRQRARRRRRRRLRRWPKVAAGFAQRALAAIDRERHRCDRRGRRGRPHRAFGSAPKNPTSRSRPICAATGGLLRLEGPAKLGEAYALRATVAYKGTWVRMIRTVVRNDARGAVTGGKRRSSPPRSPGCRSSSVSQTGFGGSSKPPARLSRCRRSPVRPSRRRKTSRRARSSTFKPRSPSTARPCSPARRRSPANCSSHSRSRRPSCHSFSRWTSAARLPISSPSISPAGDDPSCEEFDDALRSVGRHSRNAAQERPADRRGRDVHPRFDRRDQHRDRTHGRAHGAARDRRDARRLQHRPRQPARSLQPVLQAARRRTCRGSARSRSPSA